MRLFSFYFNFKTSALESIVVGANTYVVNPSLNGWYKFCVYTNASGSSYYFQDQFKEFRSADTSWGEFRYNYGLITQLMDNFYLTKWYGSQQPTYTLGGVETNSNVSSETEARDVIQAALLNKMPSAAIYTGQQLYVKYLNETQMLGTFDKVAVYGNQRWAFNYVTGGESYTRITDLAPSLYVWENATLGIIPLQQQVEALIESTKA